MLTSFPILFIFPENQSLFDLRKRIAEEIGVPYYNINLARGGGSGSAFPIISDQIETVREFVKKFVKDFFFKKIQFKTKKTQKIDYSTR